MPNLKRLIFLALAVVMLLTMAVGSATARRFSLSSNNFRFAWAAPGLLFHNVGENYFAQCNVVLEGTLHARTISKVSGQLIGYVTSATLVEANCTSNTAGVLQTTLPWHVRYNSFAGPLPRITGVHIQIVDAGIRVTDLGLTCLFQSTAAKPWHLILNSNEVTGAILGVESENGSSIPFKEGEGFCPTILKATGIGGVSVLAGTAAITVRLVT